MVRSLVVCGHSWCLVPSCVVHPDRPKKRERPGVKQRALVCGYVVQKIDFRASAFGLFQLSSFLVGQETWIGAEKEK